MSIPNVVLGAAFMLTSMHDHNEEWKDRIRKQWKESRKLPRKKKKAKRKDLLLDWRIACSVGSFSF